MAEPPDLEARVTALEAEVRQLASRVHHSEQDAAAARVLAGGADRDVAEIRTDIREFREQNTRVLNAMREDLTDVRRDMTDVRRDLTDTRQDLTDTRREMHTGFLEIRGRLDATAAGQQRIADMLTTLIARGDDEPPGR